MTDDTCNSDVTSLCMVTFLGLDGVDCLRLAQHLVPVSFANIREKYITKIVNGILDKEVLSTSNYPKIIKLALDIPSFVMRKCNNGYFDDLKKISFSTGKSHSIFIAPPVTTCIQSDCPLQNTPG